MKNHVSRHWTGWWYGNRTHLLGLSYHVDGGPTTSGGDAPPAPLDWRDRAREALRTACDAKRLMVRSEAAVALGRAGDARDTGFLMKMLANRRRKEKVRGRAALGIGLLPTTGVPDDVLKDTRAALLSAAREAIGGKDEYLELWSNATYALGLRGDTAAMPALLNFVRRFAGVRDTSNRGVHQEVMAAGLATLGMLGDTLVRPELERALAAEGKRGKRRKETLAVYAAQGLARMGSREALAALRAALVEEEPEVRCAAGLALGALAANDDDETAGALASALADDRDLAVRHVCAIALGRVAHASAREALLTAYEDGVERQRPFVVVGLGLFARATGDGDVKAFLRKKLPDATTETTGALAIANGLARNQAVVPALRDMAKKAGDHTVRSHAAFGLGLLGARDPATVDVLRKILLGQGDPWLRREAAMALGMIGDRGAVDILIDRINKKKKLNQQDQGVSCVLLGRIGDHRAAAPLAKVLLDRRTNAEVQACAAIGLGLLLDRTEGRKLGQVVADLNYYETSTAVDAIFNLVD